MLLALIPIFSTLCVSVTSELGGALRVLPPMLLRGLALAPGTLFSDLVFNLVMAEIVLALGRRLRSEDLVTALPWAGRSSLCLSTLLRSRLRLLLPLM